MKTLLHIIRKEFNQFRRDPRMFGITLLAPIVQIVLLGYAVNMDLTLVHTIIWDQDNTKTSNAFVREIAASEIFRVDAMAASQAEIDAAMERGSALIAVVLPNNFEHQLQRRETATLQMVVNSADGNSALIASGYIQGITAKYNKRLAAAILDRNGRRLPPTGSIAAEPRVWYNPFLLTRYYMIPGIFGLLVSIITLLLTSLAVVKEKEIGTLEQLIVTPIRPYQLIIGKLVPFLLMSMVAMAIVLITMYAVFGIAVRGSITLLFFCGFLYALSTLGLGLFVSTISKTQQQAMMISIFGAMMPMVYLSGFAFPLENMPVSIQAISYGIPLRYFMTIIRGIILKGLGLADIWLEALLLLLMGSAILILAASRFRKRLD